MTDEMTAEEKLDMFESLMDKWALHARTYHITANAGGYNEKRWDISITAPSKDEALELFDAIAERMRNNIKPREAP